MVTFGVLWGSRRFFLRVSRVRLVLLGRRSSAVASALGLALSRLLRRRSAIARRPSSRTRCLTRLFCGGRVVLCCLAPFARVVVVCCVGAVGVVVDVVAVDGVELVHPVPEVWLWAQGDSRVALEVRTLRPFRESWLSHITLATTVVATQTALRVRNSRTRSCCSAHRV